MRPNGEAGVRILVATQHFGPELGGAEVMLRRLAAAWAGAGHAVTVWAPRWQVGWPLQETVQVGEAASFAVARHPVSTRRLWGTLGYIRRLRGMLRRHAAEFDVVYASMFKHAAYACTTAGTRLPVVIRAEGGGASGDMAWQRSARFGGVVKRACQRAAAFVAPSTAIAAELREAGYDDCRTSVLPNGVEVPAEPWRRDAAAAWRARLRLPQRPTVVYTGRLHEGKGLRDLAAALPLLPAGAQAVLVGEGPDGAALAGCPGVLQVGKTADVTPYLRAADCFALPSYDEGLSLALLEALALGMPCVASDIPANRGLAPPGALALAPIRTPAALANALRPCLAGAWPHGPAQRAWVSERFSLAATAARHLELFAALRSRG